MTRIRLAMNASPLLLPHTGIAAYTRNLAQALLRSGEVDARFFYGFGWSREIRAAALPGAGGLRAVLLKLLPRPYWLKRLGVQQRNFARGVRQHGFDVYHEPSFLSFRFPGPSVITIHDLSPLRYPETHPPERVRNIKQYLPDAIARAARIITDSEFVKREVVETLQVDPRRIEAIHLGVSPDYRPRRADETSACLARYGLQHGSYVLAVGTLEPRKNLVEAVEAHASLPEPLRKRLPLVIAGAKGWLSAELEERIAADEVRWLGYVPAADLPVLYSAARLLVYPSIYEGFGLPVLEAMASGIPVLTSDQASLPEVAGEAALMVNPREREALRNAILRLVEDSREAARRVELGLVQARRFTWERCAERTLSVYRQALGA